MAPLQVQVTGAEHAVQELARLEAGCREVSRVGLVVGATARYAGFVEYGTRRTRAQPYLRPAALAAEHSVRARLVRALPEGTQPVAAALLGIGHDLEREAQRRAPVRTGTLRASIYSARTGRA